MNQDNNNEGEGQAYGETRIAPAFQSEVFLIMFKSNKLGGTYTEVRRSKESLERFLHGLDMMGFNMDNVQVFEQSKPWIPVRKTKPKKVKVEHDN